MKKILLATSALGLIAAAAAHAEGPTVTVGGSANFQAGYGDQKSVFKNQSNLDDGLRSENSIFAREWHTRTDTLISFKVDGKSDNGLGYGAYIELNADTSVNETATSAQPARRTYIYLESGFGRVETGATGDAGDALKVGAETFARATGGIAGDFRYYVDLAPGDRANNATYQIAPGLPTAMGLPGDATTGYDDDFGTAANRLHSDTHSDRANANKINYYTPRIQGLQAGLGFTPDQGEHGSSSGFSSVNAGGTNFVNVWNGGVNYEGQVNNVGIKAAVTGEKGSAKDSGTTAATVDDLKAYSAGVNLSYSGFTVGGSYGSANEFGTTKTFNSSLDYWTLGAAYEFGPFGTSVTYFDSEVQNYDSSRRDASFNNLSVGADYKLAPGLMPYVEVSFFDADNGFADTATTSDNSGTVFIVGTQVNF